MKFAISTIQIVISSKEDALSSEDGTGSLSRWRGRVNRRVRWRSTCAAYIRKP